MVSVEMTSVTTTHLHIINKIDNTKNKEISVEITRSLKTHENQQSIQGICKADMYLKKEKDTDKSFLVSVEIVGNFNINQDASYSHDELRDIIMKELMPHLRACMASGMSVAGLTPYLIPTSFIVKS